MNKIKSIRVLKGIKQKEMAEILGITPQYLSRLEKKEADLKISTLKQIAKVLDVGIKDLLEEDIYNEQHK
ncbi:helix-turn-helix transcriptional regulator [Paraclostridium sordellii]|uniref:helix-turn-helix domain-containing protein n=1 Tax=Paraclostridium sordellii TaxID=1505 RepID=UPI0030D16191